MTKKNAILEPVPAPMLFSHFLDNYVIFGILFSHYIEEIRVLITTVFNIRLFPEEIYFLSQMPSEINLGYIFIISFFSLLITFFATIFPSLSAAKLDPIEALKYE